MAESATVPESPTSIGDRLMEITCGLGSASAVGQDGGLTTYGLDLLAQMEDAVDALQASEALTPADALSLAVFAHVTAKGIQRDPTGYLANAGVEISLKLVDYMERHSGEKASRFMVDYAAKRH